MAIEPSISPYGSMTLFPPGAWPGANEDVLAAAAQSYEALANQLRDVVVPQQQGQLTVLANQWSGVASQAAQAEGAQLVQGHEDNAAHAADIANKLRLMEATVVRTKMAVNLTADETQANCDAIDATPAEPPEKEAAKAQAVAMGLAQNIETVQSSGMQLGSSLGAPQESLPAGGMQGAQQAMQMAMQMGQQMLMQATRMGQQFGQQLGQLAGSSSSPAQQVPASLGQLASSHSPASMSSPSMFSNHPLAGGSGPSSGAGLMRPASFPGAGTPSMPGGGAPGSPMTAGHGGGSSHGGGGGGAAVSRASLMANVASSIMAGSAPAAGSAATGSAQAGTGAAPVAGGGGGGTGGTGAMGNRGTSGGSRAALSVPGALDHDLTDGDADDEW